MVIAAYRPKPGRAGDLRERMRHHLSTLKGEKLVTDRPSIMMVAKDGTVI